MVSNVECCREVEDEAGEQVSGSGHLQEKHSGSMRKEWRFEGLKRDGMVTTQFFPDLTTTAFDIHPSFI